MAIHPRIVRGKAGREIVADLRRFRRDIRWFEANLRRLKRKYPRQWVAVLDGQVVGANRDFERLLVELKGRGVDQGRCLIEATDMDEYALRLVSTSAVSG